MKDRARWLLPSYFRDQSGQWPACLRGEERGEEDRGKEDRRGEDRREDKMRGEERRGEERRGEEKRGGTDRWPGQDEGGLHVVPCEERGDVSVAWRAGE